MGNGCCRDEEAVPVVNPTIRQSAPSRRAQNNEVRASPDVAENNNAGSSNNINRRYAQYFEILKDRTSGTGIKKTASYKSKISKEELDRKRTEFWETQVEGDHMVWQALQNACESDEETAQAIVSAMEIKLIHKNLQTLFDSKGAKYDVPIFCINEPIQYDIEQKKQINKDDFSGESLLIKVRRIGVPHDLELNATKKMTIAEVKEEFINKAKETELNVANIRLFYGGRELQDGNFLGEYGIESEHVLQMFTRK